MLTLLFFIGKEQMMAKKFTPMQELFRHEQQRLRRAIARELRTTGVELDRNLIPEMPKRVTQKQLENIKGIRPRDLRYETTYYDPEDLDRQINYQEAKRIWQEEQRQVEMIPQIHYESSAIDNYLSQLEGFNTGFQAHMKSWLSGLVKEKGVDAVAEMLQKGAENGVTVTPVIAYDASKRAEYMADMLNYLPLTSEQKAQALEAQENVQEID